MQFNGQLVFGKCNPEDPREWHICDNASPGGEYTACGVAFTDEMAIIAEKSGEELEFKDSGICTCGLCINHLFKCAEVLKTCPDVLNAAGLKVKKGGKG